jgi:DNA-directed RNA polymerase subunit M/transcription elongation factor TFIIS
VSRTHGDRSDPTDKVRTLKKQVESLKRDVSRLERELRKSNARLSEVLNMTDEEIENAYEEKSPKRKGEGQTCDNCGKGTYVAFTLPTRSGEKTYLTCPLCKDRKLCK